MIDIVALHSKLRKARSFKSQEAILLDAYCFPHLLAWVPHWNSTCPEDNTHRHWHCCDILDTRSNLILSSDNFLPFPLIPCLSKSCMCPIPFMVTWLCARLCINSLGKRCKTSHLIHDETCTLPYCLRFLVVHNGLDNQCSTLVPQSISI